VPVRILYPIALTYIARKLELKKTSIAKRRIYRKTSMSNVERRRMSTDEYGVFQAYYSPLLVLVCRSVSQDPHPPGQLKTSLSCRSFILSVDRAQPISGRVCARGTWPTNQRSPLAQTPLFSERQAINRSPCVNIC